MVTPPPVQWVEPGDAPSSPARVRIESPFRPLLAEVSGLGVIGIRFAEGSVPHEAPAGVHAETADRLRRWFERYFQGESRPFDLPLVTTGTPFQRAVWTALCTIPVGQTRSYAELAASIGKPDAVRAVGRANALNPFPIVCPCHRVVGSDGSLTGYAGGLEMKRALLELEGATPAGLFTATP